MDVFIFLTKTFVRVIEDGHDPGADVEKGDGVGDSGIRLFLAFCFDKKASQN